MSKLLTNTAVVALIVGIVFGSISCVFAINSMAIPQSNISVSISPKGFNPPQFNTTIGSTVTWRNDDNQHHTITSDTGIFDSNDIGPGGTFTYTFNGAGSFPYHSSIGPRWIGGINVG